MRILFIGVFLLFSLNGFFKSPGIDPNYLNVYATLENMLSNKEPASFKYAVFLTENLSMNNALIYSKFDEHIIKLATLIKYWVAFGLIFCPTKDSLKEEAVLKFVFIKSEMSLFLKKKGHLTTKMSPFCVNL